MPYPRFVLASSNAKFDMLSILSGSSSSLKMIDISEEDKSLKIYDKEIHFAFLKLTQNIIHTFKFYHTEVDNLEHLQHEIIVFLLSKIHLFDPTRGAKAYSYFGTIVKRWLM